MTFTITGIIDSLSGFLKAKYPQYPVYDSPNQQGSRFPCFFVFPMPSSVDDEVGSRYRRDLGIDIIFVQQRNAVNQNYQLCEIAEYLDVALETFPYTDGSGSEVPLHTFERQWQIEDQELHYQFHIRQRVCLPEETNLMREMEEYHAGIKK